MTHGWPTTCSHGALPTRSPVLVAAMNVAMWEHAAVQANTKALRARGAIRHPEGRNGGRRARHGADGAPTRSSHLPLALGEAGKVPRRGGSPLGAPS
jgi:hypothetical protein